MTISLERMDTKEFDKTLKQLGLTQIAVGRIFRNVDSSMTSGERAAQRWAEGAIPVPGGVAVALRLMRELQFNPYPLVQQVYNQPSRNPKATKRRA